MALFTEDPTKRHIFLSSLFGGGFAGMFVDMVLFPLDTITTRLQAKEGFMKAGGFKGMYKGIGPQAIGGAPQAALFFVTYEHFKYYVEPKAPENMLPLVYMSAAALSEVMACLVRVPMEVVKQRRQVSSKYSSWKILQTTWRHEGFIGGLYKGFGSTILRDVPFSIIQFPILEHLKMTYRQKFKNNIPLESWEVAGCGAIAGGFSAAVTTPLDMAKTRIMLSEKESLTIGRVLVDVYNKGGVRGVFAGFWPRILFTTLGGFIFFGAYDYSKNMCGNIISKLEDCPS